MANDEPDGETVVLRQRLAEAEAALRAICQGEVDALVVRGPDGPRVFTLRGAQEPYRVLVERMHEAALTVSGEGLILYGNRHFATLVERPLEQIVGRPVVDFVPASAAEALRELLQDGARCSARRELTFRRRDEQVPTLTAASPLPIEEQPAVLLIVTDIAERKRAEDHQTMLVAELNHRVKNILAVVQSVASQTLTASRSLPQFRTAFEGRLRAIALAHDILTQLRWGEVDLGHLVARSLAPYWGGEQVAWSGPTLLMAASAVVSLAMVLHELATNAAKYGAFSNDVGRVEIAWRALDGSMAELTWAERGGPPIAGEPVQGFGNKLITRVIAYDLQGDSTQRFTPEGLHCRLTFRIANAPPAERGKAETLATR